MYFLQSRSRSMGRGMAKNLVEKGNLAKPLIIFNRTRARADKLADAIGKDKVKVVDAVQDAVSQADIVFTCVGERSRLLSVELAAYASRAEPPLVLTFRMQAMMPPSRRPSKPPPRLT